MKTWEDVKYLYYNIAKRYIKYYPEYDINELVNEAYIMTYPYWETGNIPHRIHSTIQAYIKSQKPKYRYKFETHDIHIQSLTDWDSEVSYEIENDEFNILEPLIEKLSLDERILLYLRYVLELTEKVIGRLLGVEFQGIRYDIPSNVISYKLKCVYNKLRTCEAEINL